MTFSGNSWQQLHLWNMERKLGQRLQLCLQVYNQFNDWEEKKVEPLPGIGTTALWWWTWTEVGDVLWFLEISWETPEFSGWILIFESLNYYFSWNSLFRQVQALPRPQVRHVGLQTPEAVQALLPCSVRHLQRCHRQVGHTLSLSGTLLSNVLTMLRQNMVVDNVLTDMRCNEDTIIDVQADQAPAGPGWVDQAAWWACSPSPAKRPGAGLKQKHCFHISLRLLLNCLWNTPCGDQKAPQSLMCLGQTSTTGILFGCGHHMETLFSRETPESLDVMVTQTGRPGVIFNGVADWVYEEEVICSVFVLILQSGMLLWNLLFVFFVFSQMTISKLHISGFVGHASHLVFPRRRQDCLDPVQWHRRKENKENHDNDED